MAGKVGVSGDDYNQICTALENAQEGFIRQIDDIKKIS